MNTFSFQTLYSSAFQPQEAYTDWLDCPWGGPYEDEMDQVPECGDWTCEGCVVCVKNLQTTHYIVLPLYGPVNRDGMLLGYLILRE